MKRLGILLGGLGALALFTLSYGSIAPAQAGDQHQHTTVAAAECSCPPVPTPMCPDGWTRIDDVRVTNCCLPVEEDFNGDRAAFEADVKLDGWGRQIDGSYLGWYNGGWHTSDMPMNAHGGPLTDRSLATDRSVIAKGMSVMIPAVKDNHVFKVDDKGPDIMGKHVNFFGGEGKANCTPLDVTTSICVKK